MAQSPDQGMVMIEEWNTELVKLFDIAPPSLTHKAVDFNLDPYLVLGSVPDMSHAMCNVCQGIMQDPRVFSACGHSACYGCVKQFQTKNKCATCRAYGNPVRNIHLKPFIDNILVRCPNDRCVWTGAFKDLEDHRMEVCAEEMFFCTGCKTGYGDKYVFMDHVPQCPSATVTCKTCHEDFMRKNAAAHWRSYCEHRIVPCPLGDPCTWTGKRKDSTPHTETIQCAHRVVRCDIFGCDHCGPQYALKQHKASMDPTLLNNHYEGAKKTKEKMKENLDRAIEEFNKYKMMKFPVPDNANDDTQAQVKDSNKRKRTRSSGAAGGSESQDNAQSVGAAAGGSGSQDNA